jgi:hypothetical protein
MWQQQMKNLSLAAKKNSGVQAGSSGGQSQHESTSPIFIGDLSISGSGLLGKGLWGGIGVSTFVDFTPKTWKDIIGLGAHYEGGVAGTGIGGSPGWQIGVLLGAKNVQDAKGLGVVYIFDLTILGGISVTVASSTDMKIWSITAGPNGGAEASWKVGAINYTNIWSPLKTFFKNKKDKQ